MGNEIYMTIDKQWLEKNKVQAAKEYRERFTGEENPNAGLLFELEPSNVEIRGREVTWDLQGPDEDDPWVSVTYYLDTDDMVRLAEVLIKHLNKAKTAIEAAVS